MRHMQIEWTSIRHDIRAHPEMTMKECNITVTEGVGRLRVVGTMKSQKDSESATGLRTDGDALRSSVPG